MANDLFDDTPVIDPNKNYLEELVGEGKKFKTPEELARGKKESDTFIERLQRELAEARQTIEQATSELRSRNTVEDTLKTVLQRNSTANNVANQSTENAPEVPTLPDIDSLLNQKLTEREKARRMQDNQNLVRDAMIKSWGPNYSQKAKEVAQELGVGLQYLESIAAENPQAFLRVVGLTNEQTPVVPNLPNNSVRTSVQPGKAERGWSYYENIRKTNPTQYHSVKVQQELWNRLKELGEDTFYKS